MQAPGVEHEQVEQNIDEGEEYSQPEVAQHQRPHGAPMVIPCQDRVEQVHVDQEEAEVELGEAPPRLLAAGHGDEEDRDQHQPPYRCGDEPHYQAGETQDLRQLPQAQEAQREAQGEQHVGGHGVGHVGPPTGLLDAMDVHVHGVRQQGGLREPDSHGRLWNLRRNDCLVALPRVPCIDEEPDNDAQQRRVGRDRPRSDPQELGENVEVGHAAAKIRVRLAFP
mmetsp:Transcript_52535/g.105446  ORF Transcript_52535/g.105446 Transcript_52535/m.105446 type:complete len:223 (-) Transcript_52535:219-887(-)